MCRRGPGASRGYTLLEILLVLGLLGLTAALALPALVQPSGTELRTAAGTVAAGLRRAREAAVNGQAATSLTLDLEARSFQVSGAASGRQLPARLELSLFTAESEIESDRRGRIRFFPDGSSTGGRVTLASGERRYVVDVDWLTGQVRVRNADGAGAPRESHGRVELGS
jgi:general secretion pathway protein H